MKAQDHGHPKSHYASNTLLQNPPEPTSSAMAQNGPHGHQDAAAAASDGHSIAPATKTTVTTAVSSLTTMSTGGSSSAVVNMETTKNASGMGMNNNLIPDLNMEERDDSAGGSKDKPRSDAELAAAAAATNDADKGKSEAAVAGDGQLSVNLISERERRKKMKGLYRSLHDLMPHVPAKTNKVELVGEAIDYIRVLEEKAAMLRRQKQKQEQDLGLTRFEPSSSSSFSLNAVPVPQTAQGMVALYTSGGGGGVPLPPAAAPAVPGLAAPSPLKFKTWSGQNVVLTVANDSAYFSVCAPRRTNTLTTVLSVLDNHGIEVITAQISSDNVRSLFLIFAKITGIDGQNTSSEQVYQMAAAEIMLRINNNSSSDNNNINDNK